MDQFGSMPSDIRDMIEGIHIANYSVLNPPLPLGFTSWIYHQFTSTGDAQAIAPNSVNKFELDLNYGHGTITPPPPTNGETMDAYQIKAVLNIRTGAGTSFLDVGDVLAGDVIWGDPVIVSASDKWLKLSGWMRGGVQLSVPANAHVSINTSNTVKIPVTSTAVNSPLIITIDGGATHTSGAVTLLPK